MKGIRTTTSLSFDKEIWAKLDDLAERLPIKVSRSALAEMLLEDALRRYDPDATVRFQIVTESKQSRYDATAESSQEPSAALHSSR